MPAPTDASAGRTKYQGYPFWKAAIAKPPARISASSARWNSAWCGSPFSGPPAIGPPGRRRRLRQVLHAVGAQLLDQGLRVGRGRLLQELGEQLGRGLGLAADLEKHRLREAAAEVHAVQAARELRRGLRLVGGPLERERRGEPAVRLGEVAVDLDRLAEGPLGRARVASGELGPRSEEHTSELQ